jgi:hypothetical protein
MKVSDRCLHMIRHIAKLWDADTQIIFASIISFHFGGRAFKGGKD